MEAGVVAGMDAGVVEGREAGVIAREGSGCAAHYFDVSPLYSLLTSLYAPSLQTTHWVQIYCVCGSDAGADLMQVRI